ncbi:MAG: hypothetical protein MZV70_65610 [Desulfobacterales bacterium]|nr:hypothetical protein [Desulfobacterales bacterium]
MAPLVIAKRAFPALADHAAALHHPEPGLEPHRRLRRAGLLRPCRLLRHRRLRRHGCRLNQWRPDPVGRDGDRRP